MCVRVGAVGTGGSAEDGFEGVGWRGSLVWVTQTTLIKYTQSNANLPLKYTKLIGVEGHVHKQPLFIKCPLRRGKYSHFNRLKWEKELGFGGVAATVASCCTAVICCKSSLKTGERIANFLA